VSLHPTKTPSVAEVLAASNREIPKSLKTATLALFAIGAAIFLIGLFAGHRCSHSMEGAHRHACQKQEYYGRDREEAKPMAANPFGGQGGRRF